MIESLSNCLKSNVWQRLFGMWRRRAPYAKECLAYGTGQLHGQGMFGIWKRSVHIIWYVWHCRQGQSHMPKIVWHIRNTTSNAKKIEIFARNIFHHVEVRSYLVL